MMQDAGFESSVVLGSSLTETAGVNFKWWFESSVVLGSSLTKETETMRRGTFESSVVLGSSLTCLLCAYVVTGLRVVLF